MLRESEHHRIACSFPESNRRRLIDYEPLLSKPPGSPGQVDSARVDTELNASGPKAEQAMAVIRFPKFIGQRVPRQALNRLLSDDQASAALAPLSESSAAIIAVWRLSALAPLLAGATPLGDGLIASRDHFRKELSPGVWTRHLADCFKVFQDVFSLPTSGIYGDSNTLRSNQATSGRTKTRQD